MAHLQGPHIDSIYITGSAQAHIGDNIINHFHNADQSQVSTYETLLKCLAFDGMDTRARNVAPAFPRTCEWLLTHQDFVAWTDNTRMHEHDGFLWIKGKPGSGKSTILKETLVWAEKTWSHATILSYFFNARSPNSLEKSRLGLYRSLLHQMLCSLPAVRPLFQMSFASKLMNEQFEEWTETEMENFLVQVTKLSDLPNITVFIDALDEGADDDVRRLITFIEFWTQYAITAGCQLRVCLSSRHYPHISVAKGLSLVIEDQSEHHRDIELYLSRKLVGGTSPETNDLRNKVRDRSAGVFLWIVLVVPILNKAYGEGQSAATMLRKLRETPQELGNFFDQIIFKDTQDLGECVALLQWVLYARIALSPLELYCVVKQTNLRRRDTDSGVVTQDEAIRYLRNCSHGLLELTKSQQPKVQFIHETVRDCLMGYGGVHGVSQSKIAAQRFEAHMCHTKLAEACLRYLSQCHHRTWTREEVIAQHPFADYAARNWWRHLQSIPRKCSKSVVQQAAKLLSDRKRGLFSWVKLYDIDDDAPNPNVSVNDLAPPLYYAAIIGRSGLVRELLSFGADPNAEGWHGTALQMACKGGHRKVVQWLIDAGADVNGEYGLCGTALQAAVVQGHKKVVELLINARAMLEANNRNYGTALYEATRKSHIQIVQVLIRAGANADGEGGPFGSALDMAIRGNHEHLVRLLVDAGANVNRYGGADSGKPLQVAARHSREGIVQILINAGAKVNSRVTGDLGTALQIAVDENTDVVARLLIDAGADTSSIKSDILKRLREAPRQ